MKSSALPVALIGSSTGGPGALRSVLSEVPHDFGGVIVIAQHIHSDFVAGLATWLSETTGHSVRVPVSGEVAERGVVYLAGTHGDIALTSLGTFVYQAPSPDQVHTPCIDVVFRECSQEMAPSFAAILTGMGSDGAISLDVLQRAGWRTLVQSKETCAVAGMPSAALLRNQRHEVLDPTQIGVALRKFFVTRQENVCQPQKSKAIRHS